MLRTFALVSLFLLSFNLNATAQVIFHHNNGEIVGTYLQFDSLYCVQSTKGQHQVLKFDATSPSLDQIKTESIDQLHSRYVKTLPLDQFLDSPSISEYNHTVEFSPRFTYGGHAYFAHYVDKIAGYSVVYASSESGHVILLHSDQETEIISLSDKSEFSIRSRDISVNEKGHIYLVDQYGVRIYDGDSWSHLTDSDGLAFTGVQKILHLGESRFALLLLGNFGIQMLEDGNVQPYNKDLASPISNPKHIYMRYGDLWIESNQAIARFNDGSWDIIYEDSEAYIWRSYISEEHVYLVKKSGIQMIEL